MTGSTYPVTTTEPESSVTGRQPPADHPGNQSGQSLEARITAQTVSATSKTPSNIAPSTEPKVQGSADLTANMSDTVAQYRPPEEVS